MYSLFRNILFNFDPEGVHYFSMDVLRKASKIKWINNAIASQYQLNHSLLKKELFGLTFNNPVGLGAGFDKNAVYLNELELLGFGFVEIGTVTPKPQDGNDKPRLFRLPGDNAIINRMGFNNDGVEAVAKRLRERQNNLHHQPSTINGQFIIGGNIGKNKATPNEDAWKDYTFCFNVLFDCVDYFVVNVSSPNTPGLRELQEKSSLLKILSALQQINQGQSKPKPLLLKIAPDLTNEQIDDIIDLATAVNLSGLVATNTTINRQGLLASPKQIDSIGAGGLSGKPLRLLSTEVVRYIHRKTNGAIPLIASGGIFTGQDAQEKLDAGASLLQVWTGFIYEGPSIVKNICKHLIQ